MTIRKATPDDAGQVLAHLQALIAEPGVYLKSYPDEFAIDVEAERAYLARTLQQPNSTYLVAEADGAIVGTSGLQGGGRAATRHVAHVGLGVAKGWRGRGVGTALVAAAIEWARTCPGITRLELDVFAGNEPAIRLYQRSGFKVEALRRRAVIKDGRTHDMLVMGLVLEPEPVT